MPRVEKEKPPANVVMLGAILLREKAIGLLLPLFSFRWCFVRRSK